MVRRYPEEQPRPGESIFSDDQPWNLNACVDFLRGDWIACAEGFRAVAERAALHLIESGSMGDYEVYGFASIWRHHLELLLKALVQVADVPNAEIALRNHRLVPLWELLQPIFDEKAELIGEWREERKLLEGIVRDFDAIDPFGMDFRYPGNRDRTEASLLRAPARINLARLNKWMVWASNVLGGVFDAITCGEGRVHIGRFRGLVPKVR